MTSPGEAAVPALRVRDLRKTYDNGVRKITYRDPDGNEIGLGGAPL